MQDLDGRLVYHEARAARLPYNRPRGERVTDETKDPPELEPDDDDGDGEHEHGDGEHEHGDGDGDGDGDAPQANAGPDAADPKAVKKLETALTRERERHANRLGDLLGEAGNDLLPCPLCFHDLQGFVIPASLHDLSDETRGILQAILGVEPEPELQPAEGVVECARCNGFGQLRYPTRNVHLETQTCPACSGNGYTTAPGQGAAVVPLGGSAAGGVVSTFTPAQPCTLCGMAGMAGQPHYCNPAGAQAG